MAQAHQLLDKLPDVREPRGDRRITQLNPAQIAGALTHELNKCLVLYVREFGGGFLHSIMAAMDN